MFSKAGSPSETLCFLANIKTLSKQTIRATLNNKEIIIISSTTSIFCFTIPFDLEVGYYEITIIMEDIGPFYHRFYWTNLNMNMEIYNFICFPIINYINTNVGSPRGQIININGFGFSNTTGNISIYAGLTPCYIINIKMFNIECEIKEDIYINQSFYIQGNGVIKTSYIYNRPISLLSMISYYINENLGNVFLSNETTQYFVDEIVEEFT